MMSITHFSEGWVVIMDERRKISDRKGVRKRNIVHFVMTSRIRGRVEATNIEMKIANI